jgi:quercetin dioxygenase-like cupin family protein
MEHAYYHGLYKHDAQAGQNRGWIVGTFMEGGPRKTNEVEIKYWEFKAGEDPRHGMKVSAVIECTLVLAGKTKCLVGAEEVMLGAGEYIVIKPGVPNNTVAEIIQDAAGITVKAPSDPSAKKLLD